MLSENTIVRANDKRLIVFSINICDEIRELLFTTANARTAMAEVEYRNHLFFLVKRFSHKLHWKIELLIPENLANRSVLVDSQNRFRE